jgi:hypothetical protein
MMAMGAIGIAVALHQFRTHLHDAVASPGPVNCHDRNFKGGISTDISDDEYRRQAAYAEKQSQLAKNDMRPLLVAPDCSRLLGLLRKRPQSEDDTEGVGKSS